MFIGPIFHNVFFMVFDMPSYTLRIGFDVLSLSLSLPPAALQGQPDCYLQPAPCEYPLFAAVYEIIILSYCDSSSPQCLLSSFLGACAETVCSC